MLILWKYKFRKTHEVGKALFGENYLLFRHEDLLCAPRETLKPLYDFLGRELPQNVVDWTLESVQSNHSRYAPDHKEWRKAFKRLDMDEELSLAGYSCPGFWDLLKDIIHLRSPGLSTNPKMLKRRKPLMP